MSDRLIASGVGMMFGGVQALTDVSIEVAAGRIVGLIGRNGSGKSTLFNCITGFATPNTGAISIGGISISGMPPHRIVEYGIARTFQTPRIDANLTVRDAVVCGSFQSVRSSFLAALMASPASRREEQTLSRRTDFILDRLGLGPFVSARLSELSMGQIRLVEVARAMAASAKFMLLDEPAAGLTRDEQETLAGQIRDVAGEGIGVLLVEHNFGLVRRLCEQVTVLDEGRVLCVGPPGQIANDERVLRSYLGDTADLPQHSEAAE